MSSSPWCRRWVHTANFVGGIFNNLNAGNPNNYAYLINPTNQSASNRGINNSAQRSANVRLTWQADAKNKFSVFVDDQGRCQCANVNGTTSPEAANDLLYPIERMATVAWTAPVSNRLLLEARGGFRGEHYEYSPTKTDPDLDLIPVTELGGPVPGILYHGTGLQANTQPYQNTYGRNFDTLATMSYVTGSHAFKTGMSDTIILRDESLGDDAHVSYVFNSPDTNPTVPNPVQIQERTTPYLKSQRQPAGIGLFAQDKWTLKQLTLNLGARFDYLDMYAPALHLGPAPLVPTQNIDLPETQLVSWKDITPRMAAAYDVFGNGKTAFRISLSKYVVAQGVQWTYGDQIIPVNRLANVVTRSWTDSNHNLVPDCNLQNPLANGECGTMSDTNFGSATASTTLNPNVLNGWGVRPYDWEFSTGIQHEILPRVSVDFGYFRRWFGNFAVTANRAVSASDYTPFSITAPSDPRLPNAGQAVTGLYNLVPNQVGNVNNYFTFASDYGNETQHWNGFDLTLNANLPHGVLLRGGLSTGKTMTDDCDLVAKLPGLLFSGADLGVANTNVWLPASFCHQESPVPHAGEAPGNVYGAQSGRADQRIVPEQSGTTAGGQRGADQRPGAAADRAPAVGLEHDDREPGAAGLGVWRAAEPARHALCQDPEFRGLRTSVNLDVYNVFNTNAVLAELPTYTLATSTWRVPSTILTARFAKISVQLDF